MSNFLFTDKMEELIRKALDIIKDNARSCVYQLIGMAMYNFVWSLIFPNDDVIENDNETNE